MFRESRGFEVRYPFFTDQFRGARLREGLDLDREIDGISGATLSVRALTKLARLALLLHAHRDFAGAGADRRVTLSGLARWHRRLGITGALFFILLATTGVILNHTDALRLDSRFVQAEWLLDLYRISPPVVAPGFSVGDKIVSGLGDRLYLDTLELTEHEGPLLGAVQFERMLVVAVSDEILLLTPAGEVIERLSGADGVPAGMRRIGRDTAGRLLVRGAHGDYSADLERVEWRHEVDSEVTWAEPVTLPPGLRDRLVETYRGKACRWSACSWMSTGRILGAWGVYLVDAAAVLFLGLVLTGLWMWLRRPR